MIIMYAFLSLVLGILTTWYIVTLQCQAKNHRLQTLLENAQQQLADTKTTLTQAQAQNLQLATKLASLETAHQGLLAKQAAQKQEIETMQETLTIQFKNLANDLLEEKSKKFTEQNKTNLAYLLAPLGEKIQAFEKQVAQTNQDSLTRNTALRTELQQLHALNRQITQEAANLTKALKGDQKMQGNWGEFILESILEKSGLVKDREYLVQPTFVTPTGKRYQPDIILKLPEDKHIIIDAKVSLVNYEQYCNTTHEATRALQCKQHLQSIRRHLKTLSEKNYATQYDLKSLDFVCMFIPIEPAFSLAVQEDPTLFQEAYEKNIIMVSPTTLLATLRTITNLWKHEYQNQHAVAIAQQSGALYDKLVDFIEDLEKIGRQMDLTHQVYLKATQKLYEGRGNLVSKAQQIKTLGASTSKVLDPKLIARANPTQ